MLLRGKLLLLLGSKLLLLGKSWLLLLSRGKLLGVLSKLLVLGKLGIKLARLLLLLSRLLSKLLLGLLGKLLSRLLRLLLSLLKVLEVLIKVLGIELFRCRTAGVEVGGIEHLASGSLSTLVCKGLALGRVVSLTSNLLLPLHNRFLMSNHGSMTLCFQSKCGVNWSSRSFSTTCRRKINRLHLQV